MRWNRLWLAGCIIGSLAGCGAQHSSKMAASVVPEVALAQPAAANAPDDLGKAGAAPPKGVQHKIIHTADMRLVVDDFAGVSAKIAALVDKAQGYIANSSVHGTAGKSRVGNWKVRIPIAAYDSFLIEAERLGSLESLSTDSQDVTAEFFDLEARIRNKHQEESRLLKHLDQSTGKLDEILNVERELSRVREEIERMEGRRNVLQDLTAMTTVTLTVSEDRDYVPVAAPTYAARLSHSFAASVHALQTAGAETLLAAVVVSPWAAVLGMLLLCVVVLRRAIRRTAVGSIGA